MMQYRTHWLGVGCYSSFRSFDGFNKFIVEQASEILGHGCGVLLDIGGATGDHTQ